MSASTDDMKRGRNTPPEAGCTGKAGFTSYSLAVKVTQRVKRNATKQDKSRSAYRCGHCGLWHVGSDHTKAKTHKAIELRERRNHEI